MLKCLLVGWKNINFRLQKNWKLRKEKQIKFKLLVYLKKKLYYTCTHNSNIMYKRPLYRECKREWENARDIVSERARDAHLYQQRAHHECTLIAPQLNWANAENERRRTTSYGARTPVVSAKRARGGKVTRTTLYNTLRRSSQRRQSVGRLVGRCVEDDLGVAGSAAGGRRRPTVLPPRRCRMPVRKNHDLPWCRVGRP